jgi:hypothetical protein
MELEDVNQWLRDGEEWEAADLLSQCEFRYVYVDTGFPFDDGPGTDIFELYVHAPRKILDRIATDFKSLVASIEEAVSQIAQSQHSYVRSVYWVPRIGHPLGCPPDNDVEIVLARLDREHVRAAWSKALSRRDGDPDGAITAARTLLESVCKHILSNNGVDCARNSDLPTLYHQVAESLKLSPVQHIDKNVKRILGSCQAVVSGVAFLRNQLGDAHATDLDSETALKELGELAVNLSGSLALFLVKVWEQRRSQ